jgi:hypothetical protein
VSDQFEVAVTFDAERGYIGSAPELRQPIVALSLGGLRRRIEIIGDLSAAGQVAHLQRGHQARLRGLRWWRTGRSGARRWQPVGEDRIEGGQHRGRGHYL